MGHILLYIYIAILFHYYFIDMYTLQCIYDVGNRKQIVADVNNILLRLFELNKRVYSTLLNESERVKK